MHLSAVKNDLLHLPAAYAPYPVNMSEVEDLHVEMRYVLFSLDIATMLLWGLAP